MVDNNFFVSVEELKKAAKLKTFEFEGIELPMLGNIILEALSKCKKYTRNEIRGQAEWADSCIGWKCSACDYRITA